MIDLTSRPAQHHRGVSVSVGEQVAESGTGGLTACGNTDPIAKVP